MTGSSNSLPGPIEGPTGGVVWDRRRRAVQRHRRRPPAAVRSGQQGGQRVSPLHQPRERSRTRARTASFTARRKAGGGSSSSPPDGRVIAVDALLDGKYHNQPCDLTVDSRHRIWFADPRHPVIPFGPAIFPYLDHASVLRLERNDRRAWVATRITYDTGSPRAVLLSLDETVLYVADGEPRAGRAAGAAGLSDRRGRDRRASRGPAHLRRRPSRPASRHRGHVPGCRRQYRGLRRLEPERTGAADPCVCAERRGDRKPSLPRRPAEQLLFRRRRS